MHARCVALLLVLYLLERVDGGDDERGRVFPQHLVFESSPELPFGVAAPAPHATVLRERTRVPEADHELDRLRDLRNLSYTSIQPPLERHRDRWRRETWHPTLDP